MDYYLNFILYLQVHSLVSIRESLTDCSISISWEMAMELEKVLKPMVDLTIKCQAANQIPGDFLRDLYKVRYDLEKVRRHNPTMAGAVNEMLECVEEQRKRILKSPRFLAAIYLDHRFVHRHNAKFINEEEKEMAQVH